MRSINCASGMSRPRAEHRLGAAGSRKVRRRGRDRLVAARLGAAVLVALLCLASPGGAQSIHGDAPILTRPVQEALVHLQEGWLQWTTALFSSDSERALAVVDDLLATADQLGMERLPDLAAGAMLQAVNAAREGDAARAKVALAAAERLDPGRPETAFAEAEVARAGGDPLGRLTAQVRGYARLFGHELLRAPVLINLGLWGLASLLVAGALFLGLLVLTDGRAVLNDLGVAIAGRLPRLGGPLIQVLMVAALLWPLLLPWGPVWLVLYWSVLLWRRSSVSKRVVLAVLWLVLGLTPWAAERGRELLSLRTSPPVQAMESVVHGRLYGGLFLDLRTLAAALPESPAVDQFLGDLNVRFGQWDLARRRYEKVLEAEPENVSAMIDLGAYYLTQGDHGNAVAMFQKAASIDSRSAAAQFDLSVAYAESYLYDEQRQALDEARTIDERQVARWMRRPPKERVVTVEGGFARTPEIEAALVSSRAAAWARTPEDGSWLTRIGAFRSVLAVALIVLAALALLTALERIAAGKNPSRRARRPVRPQTSSVLSGLLPGFSFACQDRGVAAFCAVLVPAALAVALVAGAGAGFGYPVPWRFDPGDWFLLWPATAGLVLMVAFRVGRTYWRKG